MYYCTAALSRRSKKSCYSCGKIVAFIFQWWNLQGGVGLDNVTKTQHQKKEHKHILAKNVEPVTNRFLEIKIIGNLIGAVLSNSS